MERGSRRPAARPRGRLGAGRPAAAALRIRGPTAGRRARARDGGPAGGPAARGARGRPNRGAGGAGRRVAARGAAGEAGDGALRKPDTTAKLALYAVCGSGVAFYATRALMGAGNGNWAAAAAQLGVMYLVKLEAYKRTRFVRERVRAEVAKGLRKVQRQPVSAAMVPLVAAFVGWFTNWLAVQMIFYPIRFWGLPIKQYVLGAIYGCDVFQPLGWVGWQGIVPAKTAQMAFDMVEMVVTKLIDVQEVIRRLSPQIVASLLAAEVPLLAQDMGHDLVKDGLLPKWVMQLVEWRGVPRLSAGHLGLIRTLQDDFVRGFVRAIQDNVDRVLDLKELVVTYMDSDKTILVEMFQRVGKEELKFLVNSGLWFGFLLGICQLLVWMFYDSPWTLTAGGTVVGYLTNWLALKCIFEPVEPVQFGPFRFQGLFPARQKEVSGEFAEFLSSKVLTSEKMWGNMLHGEKSEEFKQVLSEYTETFARDTASKLEVQVDGGVDPEIVQEVSAAMAQRMAARLEEHVHPMHGYADDALGLCEDIEAKLSTMPAKEFERVLHPIFEEDEMTLIIAGAVLGALAGAVQQAIAVAQEREKAAREGLDEEGDGGEGDPHQD